MKYHALLVIFKKAETLEIAVYSKLYVALNQITQTGKPCANKIVLVGALLNFIWGLLYEKTYLIVIKDETDLKSKLNASTLILIGSYVRKLVASYLKKGR